MQNLYLWGNYFAFIKKSYLLNNSLYVYIYIRVFANGPGDLGSVPGRVIPKTQKMVLDTSLLNTQHYKVRIKWSDPGEGVAPSLTPRCSRYWKGSLWVVLDNGRQLTLYIYIYIYREREREERRDRWEQIRNKEGPVQRDKKERELHR